MVLGQLIGTHGSLKSVHGLLIDCCTGQTAIIFNACTGICCSHERATQETDSLGSLLDANLMQARMRTEFAIPWVLYLAALAVVRLDITRSSVIANRHKNYHSKRPYIAWFSPGLVSTAVRTGHSANAIVVRRRQRYEPALSPNATSKLRLKLTFHDVRIVRPCSQRA